MPIRASRRGFLQGAAVGAAFTPLPPASAGEPNVYARLGVKPVINGVGTVTILGGSVMPPEVVRAMEEASRYFVPLPELQQKAGAKLAEMLGVPAAMVTAGAASAITVATAACVVGGDASKLRQLPDTTGLKNEVIQQKSHRSGYEAQMSVVGIKDEAAEDEHLCRFIAAFIEIAGIQSHLVVLIPITMINPAVRSIARQSPHRLHDLTIAGG